MKSIIQKLLKKIWRSLNYKISDRLPNDSLSELLKEKDINLHYSIIPNEISVY